MTSYFQRFDSLPESTTLDAFKEARSIDLSLMSVRKLTPLTGLTTYSISHEYEFFTTPTKNTITAHSLDTAFPSFIATKFRRV